ncbi:MAG: DUF2249 domain-containing protein [Chitinophagaceae bacterium]|nr:DUF2249 domain-containing protein [Chitinophagaceae bacterium]
MYTATENILDVTQLEPKQKHLTIFIRFDELTEGETLTVHNDHDPKPLYYQLLAERGDFFTWQYLEQGPQWWIVKITKRVSGFNNETLGQIAAKNLRKAEVEQELRKVDTMLSSRRVPYADWSLDFLVDYIINTHHSYIRKILPDIFLYAQKVIKVHGKEHPELIRIHQLLGEINTELITHLLIEENVLFPHIKALIVEDYKQSLSTGDWGLVEGHIYTRKGEHKLIGKKLEEIRQLSLNYILPQDACASYTLLYSMLQEFEEDMHLHIHLEHNILFPGAIAVEKQSKTI